jgi:N-acetylglucosamine-6-sulfatase
MKTTLRPRRVSRILRLTTMTAAAVLLATVAVSLPLRGGAEIVAQPAIAEEPVRAIAPGTVPSREPSIVLVLMDDASMDLLSTMRNAGELAGRGASYTNAFVVDSLCCVSRTSLLTGQYPHQTGVFTNTANLPNPHGPLGGWQAFAAHGNGPRSFNVRLQQHGYTTGYVGKFLNEYQPVVGPNGVAFPGRPPGWDEWRPVSAPAYDGWGFQIATQDGAVRTIPVPADSSSAADKDRSYSTSVIGDVALDFIRRHRSARYFLEVAVYGPHSTTGSRAFPGDPYFPPAFRDRPSPTRPFGNCGLVRCADLTVDDLEGFDDDTSDNVPRYADGRPARDWRATDLDLSVRQAQAALRNRARMVQSIDRLLGRVMTAVDDDTYVVLTSDNGFHLGQHRLWMGKGTPYDSDVRVPLVIAGPGVTPGAREMPVSNIDLAPTFEDLAGLDSPAYRAGSSFADSLRQPRVRRQRAVFFEHTWARSLGGNDPDRWYAGGTIDQIPSYVAVRTRRALLVRVDLDNRWDHTDHAWELYDYRDAPFERTNVVADPANRPLVVRLKRLIHGFDSCRHATGNDPVPDGCRTLRGPPAA